MNLLKLFNSQFFKQTLLVVLFALAVFFASTGGIQNPRWADLFGGIAISVLSAVVSIYFLQGIDKKVDPAELAKVIRETSSEFNQTHFVRVDRNMDMGDNYWIGLIDELDISLEPVWFVGTRLSWWLKTRTYREPLHSKFVGRLQRAFNMYEKSGQDVCETFFFLGNPDWVPKWKRFFQGVIDDLTHNTDAIKKKQLQEFYWSKIKIGILPPELIRYSLVLCGTRLVVTHYTSLGRSEDSPTFEVRKTSVIRQLYIDDLEILKKSASFQ